MCKRILIIPKESQEQTLESVLELPLKIQIELALYVLDTKDLCTMLNATKGFTEWSEERYSTSYKDMYEALVDENNFIIPYISKH